MYDVLHSNCLTFPLSLSRCVCLLPVSTLSASSPASIDQGQHQLILSTLTTLWCRICYFQARIFSRCWENRNKLNNFRTPPPLSFLSSGWRLPTHGYMDEGQTLGKEYYWGRGVRSKSIPWLSEISRVVYHFFVIYHPLIASTPVGVGRPWDVDIVGGTNSYNTYSTNDFLHVCDSIEVLQVCVVAVFSIQVVNFDSLALTISFSRWSRRLAGDRSISNSVL